MVRVVPKAATKINKGVQNHTCKNKFIYIYVCVYINININIVFILTNTCEQIQIFKVYV